MTTESKNLLPIAAFAALALGGYGGTPTGRLTGGYVGAAPKASIHPFAHRPAPKRGNSPRRILKRSETGLQLHRHRLQIAKRSRVRNGRKA